MLKVFFVVFGLMVSSLVWAEGNDVQADAKAIINKYFAEINEQETSEPHKTHLQSLGFQAACHLKPLPILCGEELKQRVTTAIAYAK